MTPADIDRVFGRGRLRMVTGEHVEVFREASLPGERRRYTKRFLATPAGDFREWTEREWRILARLVGHGVRVVPQVVQFDRGAADRPALVQTYDAGITIDHWATLLPLERDGTLLRNVFEDCAHWWALARHCLIALDAIHELQLVHLDLKADNVCIPIAPADFDPSAPRRALHPRFDEIALIDFAFSLVSGEPLESALPIAHQADYEYQSPRLLRALDAGRYGDLAPTRELDWRCDLFSLAAMLWRYLPELEDTTLGGWTRARHAKARALVRRLVEAHDAALPVLRPHAEFIALASEPLEKADLRESLERGWRLAIDGRVAASPSPTPVTRIAMPVVAPMAAGNAEAPVSAAPAMPSALAARLAAASASAAAEPIGAVPWFFGADETTGLRVDQTDVDARALLRNGGERRRARRLAWAGGLALAAAAAASVPLLAPQWLTLPALRAGADTRIALAPTAPTRPAPNDRTKLAQPAPAEAKDTERDASNHKPAGPAVPAAGATVDNPEKDSSTAATAKNQGASAMRAAPEPSASATAASSAAPTVRNGDASAASATAATRPVVRPPTLARTGSHPAAVPAARPSPTLSAQARTPVARAGRSPAAPPAPAAAAGAAPPAAAAAAGAARSRLHLALAPQLGCAYCWF